MKITDIDFKDEAFKACVLATGCDEAEQVTRLVCRKKGIKNAEGLQYFKNLKFLDFTRNHLETLDVSENILLEELFLGNNEIKSLDLSKNKNLTHLEVFINELSELDLSNNDKLEEVYANKNELSFIDLTNNPELVDLRLSENEIEKIALPKNNELKKVHVDENPMSAEIVAQLKKELEGVEIKI